MKLVVRRSEDLSSGSCFLEVAASTSVAGLKLLLQQRFGLRPCDQRLTVDRFGHRVLLSESWPIDFYGLRDGSRVLLEALHKPREACRDLPSCQRYYQRLGLNSSPSSQLTQEACRVSATQCCEQGCLDRLLAIMQRASDPAKELSLPSSRGWTCMHFAAFKGHTEIVKALLQSHVTPNTVSEDHWTPLMLACHRGHVPCVDLLLADSRVNINQRTGRGTALHIVALKGRPQLCSLLLERGANVSLTDSKGRIPLEITSCTEIAELIPRFVGEKLMKEMGIKESKESYCAQLKAQLDQAIKPCFLVLDYELLILQCFADINDYYEGRKARISIPLSHLLSLDLDSNSPRLTVTWTTGSLICLGDYGELQEWLSRLCVHIPLHQGTEHSPSLYQEPETPRVGCENPYLSPVVSRELVGEIAACGFEVLEEIGSGSFGKVYKIKAKGHSHLFALKCLNKAAMEQQDQLSYALEENRLLKSLDHPFIVKLFHSFQTPKLLCLVLEYCPNGDLAAHIAEKGHFAEEDARIYLAELILALEHLHSKNILYRDLKPENVLLDSQGHIRLADFGLAKSIGPRSASTTFCGSPAYLAPETLDHSGSGKPADVYSLGVLMYEMITGETPFFSYNLTEMFRNIATQKVEMPNSLSPALRSLLQRLLAHRPAARPTLAEVKKDAYFKGMEWKRLSNKRLAPPRLSQLWQQSEANQCISPPPKSLWQAVKGYARTSSFEECVLDFD